MKIIFRSAVLAALIITTSCGKDDDNSNSQQSDEQAELLEKTPLEANSVSDNVIIQGSSKIEGASPTPNGGISLDLSNTSKTAFLDEGFHVSLSSDGDAIGAYLRFKAQDGTAATSYYDVNLDSNSANNKSGERLNKSKKSNSFIAKLDETTLDVDFNSTIEPGTFCYELCVYDAEGNISNPQEICVTVESWGGNSAAIGKWNLDKWFRDATPDRVYLEGVDNCISEMSEMYCQGAVFEDVERETCTLSDYWNIELKVDGTYIEKEKKTWTTTYADISQNPCLDKEASKDVYTFESTGKWSYLNDEQKFIFVTYSDEEVYNEESYSYTAEPGDGAIYYGAGGYDGEVFISDGSLIVKSFEDLTVHFKK